MDLRGMPPEVREALASLMADAMEPEGEVTRERFSKLTYELGDVQIATAKTATQGLVGQLKGIFKELDELPAKKQEERLKRYVIGCEQNLKFAKENLFDLLLKVKKQEADIDGDSFIDRIIREAKDVSGYDPTPQIQASPKQISTGTGFGFGGSRGE